MLVGCMLAGPIRHPFLLTMNEIYTTQRYMHMMHMISGMGNYEYIYREGD